MTDQERVLVGVVQQLIQAVLPYAAKHRVNKCFCGACNNLRRVLNQAAQIIEPLQPTEL